MSSRPAPRKSSLAGESPLTPPPATESAPAGESPRRKSATAHKVSFFQDRASTARMRGALLYTMASEGPRSMSQFIDHAVMTEVERLERLYNGGEPFPPIGPRELPQGRPMAREE